MVRSRLKEDKTDSLVHGISDYLYRSIECLFNKNLAETIYSQESCLPCFVLEGDVLLRTLLRDDAIGIHLCHACQPLRIHLRFGLKILARSGPLLVNYAFCCGNHVLGNCIYVEAHFLSPSTVDFGVLGLCALLSSIFSPRFFASSKVKMAVNWEFNAPRMLFSISALTRPSWCISSSRPIFLERRSSILTVMLFLSISSARTRSPLRATF